MTTRITIVFTIFFVLTLTSCKVDEKKTVDTVLLKSDWLNAKYNYILFFNDSTVLTPPDEGVFVYNYTVKYDTLSIYRNKNTCEKFQVLLLNQDVLILKNISRKNDRLRTETITFTNTSTINKQEVEIKNLKFSFVGLPSNKNFEISNGIIKYSESGNPEKIRNLEKELSPSIIRQLNLKMKLIEPNCHYDINEFKVGAPAVNLRIELSENNGNKDIFIFNGSPPLPDENIRLASFIAYLVNLDVIVGLKE